MDGGAWKAAVHGVTEGRTRLSDFTFPFHFHALEKEMATHSSVLAWRIPGMVERNGLPSMGSHRVGHDWSDLAAGAAAPRNKEEKPYSRSNHGPQWPAVQQISPQSPWRLYKFSPWTLCHPLIQHSRVPPPAGKSLPLLKSAHKVWKRGLLLQMHRHLHKATRITKNQGIMTLPKDYSKPLITGPEEMKMLELPNK